MTIKLAKDASNDDKIDEVKAHDKDNARQNIQAKGIVSVESKHVGEAAATANSRGLVFAGSTTKKALARAGDCGDISTLHDNPRL